MSRPATVAHGDKFPLLYIRRKLAWKCHNNSGKKEREGWEGKGRRVRGWSSEALPILRFILSISTISTLRNRI
jgi:hypothetical protein